MTLTPKFRHKTKKVSNKKISKSNSNKNKINLLEVKNIWKLNIKKMKPDEKRNIINDFIIKVKGNIHEISMKHEGARALQILIKHSHSKIINDIYFELEPNLFEICKSNHGRFVILSLLKKINIRSFDHIHKKLYCKSDKLLLHRYSSTIIDYYYRNCSNKQQMKFLLEYFSPKAITKSFEPNLNSNTNCLQSLLSNSFKSDEKNMKDIILRRLFNYIKKLVAKEMLTTAISHRLIFEYLSNCSKIQESDLLNMLISYPLEFAQTKVGSKVIVKLIIKSDNKQRKLLIKKLKNNVYEMSQDNYGWWIIFSLYNALDDTVLLNKRISAEIIKEIVKDDYILENKNLIKLFLHLLKANDKKITTEEEKEVLYSIKKCNSKKDDITRVTEIMNVLLTPLIKIVKNSINTLMTIKIGQKLILELIIFLQLSKKFDQEIENFLPVFVEYIASDKIDLNNFRITITITEIMDVLFKEGTESTIKIFVDEITKRIIEEKEYGSKNIKLIEFMNSKGVFILIKIMEQEFDEEVKEKLKNEILKNKLHIKNDKLVGVQNLLKMIGNKN